MTYQKVTQGVTKEQAWEALNAKFGEHFVISPACYFEYWAYPQVLVVQQGHSKVRLEDKQ